MSNPASFTGEEIHVVNRKKKGHIIFGAVAVFLALIFITTFIIYCRGGDDIIIQEYGMSLPEDWYYDRDMMNMSMCPEEEHAVRETILVDRLNQYCDDVESCVATIQTIADEANFFITLGRIFEGYGWRCNVTKFLTIKFLGQVDWDGRLSYYKLLSDGVKYNEFNPNVTVFVNVTGCNDKSCLQLFTLDGPCQKPVRHII